MPSREEDILGRARRAIHPLVEIGREGGGLSLTQVAEAARPFLTALLASETRKPLCVVLPTIREQELFFSDLETWLARIAPDEFAAVFVPEEEAVHVKGALTDPDLEAERARALLALLSPQKIPIVVCTLQGLEQPVVTPEQLRRQTKIIRRGDRLEINAWFSEMTVLGYEHAAQVGEHGEICRRGGIVDLFPLNSTDPVRVELFGDHVESIRVFDVNTQASIREVESTEITGALASTGPATLRDYLPADALRLEATEQGFQLGEGRGLAGGIEMYGLDLVSDKPMETLLIEARRNLFLEQMRNWTAAAWAVMIFSNNEGEEERLREILAEERFPVERAVFHIAPLLRGFSFPDAKLAVVTDAEIFGRYQSMRALKRQQRIARSRAERAGIDLSELSAGDHVVHVEHGIGKFRGIRPLPALSHAEGSGADAEVLEIEFANDTRLYVPVEQAHLVSRYVGVGKRLPPLDELGGTRWEKAKVAAQKAVMDYAAQLLTLQAERQTAPGHAFAPDTEWQREFEGSFLYEETPDQLRAIDDTKKDMESARPMDRLICGDVGFGKTEVAIRAAFKAVMDGRQVAVLVPTTVLAQQHYDTFRERMADYPVRIEMLSRFRSKKQQARIVADLHAGKVDIIVGTHRLLSRDVHFRNLGLAVVDEEQRFGVLHKEKFKQLFKTVDVLTLSATPIPRTLYLSLVGARDMSLLATPPQNRLPIETIVCPYDERVLRDAVLRELRRDGQVFFLHNRIGSIQAVRDRVKQLVPKARTDIGHGQMPEDELEEVMKRFVEGKTDVLISTSIIESGLDIPNANTIIIDRADRFGLADLYQLRGRVGRSNQRAYAFLMLPRHLMISAGPRKRVSAIKQYSNLGAGFQIAMRDLEIRGAGNILGTAQSGHISAVGFDLYCKLLKKTVERMKGGKGAWKPEVSVRMDFLALNPGELDGARAPAFIPADYVRETRSRLQIYRRIAETETPAEVEQLRAELRDRFGPLPAGAENLLSLAGVKALAAAAGINLVEVEENKLKMRRKSNWLQVGNRFPRLEASDAAGKFKDVASWIEDLSKGAIARPAPSS